jgi:uridine kinase
MCELPFVVAISGLSGSGKTTLAKKVKKHFHGEYICLDDYFRPTDPNLFASTDFEDPSMIDVEWAARDLDRICQGQATEGPIYDYALCQAVSHRTLHPAPVIVIEGQYSAVYDHIRQRSNLLVFLDVDWRTCLNRRIKRDATDLKRSQSDVKQRFERQVLTTFERFRSTISDSSHVTFVDGDVSAWITMIEDHYHQHKSRGIENHMRIQQDIDEN